jgi:CRP/FNR family transcriptional regulator
MRPPPSPYGLPIIEDCLTCKVREERVFCKLSPNAVKALDEIRSAAIYPKGAVLFVQGQPARGVFVLCTCRAKLTVCSKDGKALIFRIAEAGEVLGLSATVSGNPYGMTAETLVPSEINFIRRELFLKFLRENGEACMRVAQQLAQNYHSANEQIRLLGLSTSAAERLARFLLQLGSQTDSPGTEVRLKLTLTHEDIGELIGISRETVTRLLKEFKGKNVIRLKGSALVIRDKAALEALSRS